MHEPTLNLIMHQAIVLQVFLFYDNAQTMYPLSSQLFTFISNT